MFAFRRMLVSRILSNTLPVACRTVERRDNGTPLRELDASNVVKLSASTEIEQ